MELTNCKKSFEDDWLEHPEHPEGYWFYSNILDNPENRKIWFNCPYAKIVDKAYYTRRQERVLLLDCFAVYIEDKVTGNEVEGYSRKNTGKGLF